MRVVSALLARGMRGTAVILQRVAAPRAAASPTCRAQRRWSSNNLRARLHQRNLLAQTCTTEMRRGDLATTLVILVGGATTVSSQQPPSLDCAKVVAPPLDGHPVRSPQAVHTALVPHFRGKDIVEFGTRSGDGMCCFAMVARSARAFESDAKYCGRLKKRLPAFSNASGVTFEVWCMRYQKALDSGDLSNADVFTWWFGGRF